MSSKTRPTLAILVSSFSLCLLCASVSFAQDIDVGAIKDEKKKPKYDLVAWGQLKPVKGQAGYFEFSYTKTVKRRPKKMSAFVKLGDDLKVLEDTKISAKKLAVGTKAHLYGQARENETVNPLGITTMEYSLKNVSAVLIGKGIKIDPEYRDPANKQNKWHTGVISEPKMGSPFRLTIDDKKHAVTLAKRPVLLSRDPVKGSKVTTQKKRFYAFILADETEDRPETKKKSDKKKPAFETNRVILLDTAAVKYRVYNNLFPS